MTSSATPICETVKSYLSRLSTALSSCVKPITPPSSETASHLSPPLTFSSGLTHESVASSQASSREGKITWGKVTSTLGTVAEAAAFSVVPAAMLWLAYQHGTDKIETEMSAIVSAMAAQRGILDGECRA